MRRDHILSFFVRVNYWIGYLSVVVGGRLFLDNTPLHKGKNIFFSSLPYPAPLITPDPAAKGIYVIAKAKQVIL